MRTLWTSVIALSLAAPALAQDTPADGKPVMREARTKEALQQDADKSEVEPVVFQEDRQFDDDPTWFQGNIIRVVDGSVLFGMAVTPEEAKKLLTWPDAKEVKNIKDVDDQTIFAGKYYRRYRLGTTFIDENVEHEFMNKEVEIEIRTPRGEYEGRVLTIRFKK